MDIVRFFDRRMRYNIAAFGLLIATVVPTLVPALASAAQLTQRSLALSSSSADASGVSYKVNFTAVGAAGAFVVDFCSNSPTVGDTCTAPGGFDSSAAASTSAGVTAVGKVGTSTSQVLVTDPITASENVSVELTGIHNPTAAGPLYARVVTYDNATDAANYTSTVDTTTGGVVDFGGIATSITDTVGVSAKVLETMTFCVSGNVSLESSANCGTTTAPTLQLGETSGNTKALTAGVVSTGTIYTQISTNAAGGAIVNLKSDATGCGGLLLAGDPTHCYIAPALLTDVTANGAAKFGVKTGTAVNTTGVTDAAGTFEPVAASGYNSSTYALNYNGATSGVTSTYGDPILDTNNGPINNVNMPLTFGATVTNLTPAGSYSADLNLIATGTF